MTDEQIIIAVAKLDGFLSVQFINSGPWKVMGDKIHIHGHGNTIVPDYLTSRDAIIPVIEKAFSKITCHSFFDTLGIECAKDTADVDGQYEYQGDGSYYEQWLIFKATPRQLSIALVKATGNWIE